MAISVSSVFIPDVAIAALAVCLCTIVVILWWAHRSHKLFFSTESVFSVQSMVGNFEIDMEDREDALEASSSLQLRVHPTHSPVCDRTNDGKDIFECGSSPLNP